MTEKKAVKTASATIQKIKAQIAVFKKEANSATANQKDFLLKQIQELEKKQLEPAQARLNRANQALAACHAQHHSA